MHEYLLASAWKVDVAGGRGSQVRVQVNPNIFPLRAPATRKSSPERSTSNNDVSRRCDLLEVMIGKLCLLRVVAFNLSNFSTFSALVMLPLSLGARAGQMLLSGI